MPICHKDSSHPAGRCLRAWSLSCSRGRLVLIAVCLLPSLAVRAAGDSRASDKQLQLLREEHQDLRREFVQSLQTIADYCKKHGFPEKAGEILSLAKPLNPHVMRVDTLPERVQPDLPADLSPEERAWRTRLRETRREYAGKLYRLSRRVLYAGHPSYAYHLVREVAVHDPDHRAARRLLGYTRLRDRWVTPFAARMLRRDFVWHDDFGWLPESHVERYENGERLYQGRWIGAEDEARLRRDFSEAWEVRTEHFLVKTNYGLKRGVDVAEALETFYEVFFPTFAGFFNTRAQIRALFQGGTTGSRPKIERNPYIIHYYRKKQEYVQAVRRSFARMGYQYDGIGGTNAIYIPNDRTVYTFHNANGDSGANTTLFHEATHQLFYESFSRHRRIAEEAHFWAVEGIACYMESFQREGNRISLGDPRFDRFYAAQYRYLRDDYYVPLKKFAGLGKDEWQRQEPYEILRRNYSQASGLAHFFMHYDGGRYRDAFIEHLAQLYRPPGRGGNNVQSLPELTGTSYEELDRQYGEHLNNLVKARARLREQEAAQEGRR